MSFELGRATDASVEETRIRFVLTSGSVGLGDQPGLGVPDGTPPGLRRLVESIDPAAAVVVELARMCTCPEPDCVGVSGPTLQVVMAWPWETVAAMAGQLQGWMETLPVGLRDQAEAIRADQLAECRKLTG